MLWFTYSVLRAGKQAGAMAHTVLNSWVNTMLFHTRMGYCPVASV